MTDVLVVEDNFALGEFIRQSLRRGGVPYRLAQDGQQALGLADEEWPGVVLLDLTLPGTLDGWQLWDELLARSNGRRLRVILFAAVLEDVDLQQAHLRGTWAILRKPVTRARLTQVVREVLGTAALHG